MAGREVREYTNLSDPKDKKWGKGKDKIDDEDITFQRMVAKMQEVAGERGGYLHGRGALDSDDLLYLKEQMEAEEDAERLLRRTEKRAQQDLLKKVVEVKPKRPKVSNHSYGNHSTRTSCDHSSAKSAKSDQEEKECSLLKSGKTDEIKEENAVKNDTGQENTVKSLLGLAYASSDDEDVE
ncbi:hypothetical protein P3X46_025971 [Hevea brasiliensis]|uniref:Uncharacterized protein n=1 Tax=Hevea brasiliensis TaxID=3981 RepID=A0ABQ9KV55_HEVBR|nr:hypothetical protein P3X46_025971 [Hevea brasiliensis]